MSWAKGKIYSESLAALAQGGTVIVNKGGTRSGKTWALLQLCATIAEMQKGVLLSVVGESVPFLKRGALRDFRELLGDAWNEDGWNATDKVYTLTNGSAIEFFSADNEGKVHGSARDYLFLNECYFIDWEVYRQLAVRTRRAILLDYNPRSRFWVDEKIIGKPGVALVHSTYRDNPHLTAAQVAMIESNKDDENWWRVYGEGETGSVEGLVYTSWDIVSELPEVYKREFYCIDFGFTNDPTAILRVRLSGGELWVDELIYQTGMLNSDIVEVLRRYGVRYDAPIVCDSAEQKSVAEINHLGGFHAVPCSKGRGSVTAGISMVRAYRLHVTARSLGTINELRNYSWRRDGASGSYLNEPIDKYNHALDALRYGVTTYLATARTLTAPTLYRRIIK